MWIIIGYVIIIVCVLGGFMAGGGHVAALFQPLELLIIAGAAAGAFVVANGLETTKTTGAALAGAFKGHKNAKEMQLQLISLLYELLTKIRKDGLLGIEKEIDAPDKGAIFSKYPDVLHEKGLVEFMTDYLRLMVSGHMNAFELEQIMDQEIESQAEEAGVPAHAIQQLSDGLPGFGIVAAVMGVVHTMESVGLPPEELGILIARALVGTFLGILLAYGFVAPLVSLLSHKVGESMKLMQCVKVTLLACANGYTPLIAVEYGRKVLYTKERPSFIDLEAHVKSLK